MPPAAPPPFGIRPGMHIPLTAGIMPIIPPPWGIMPIPPRSAGSSMGKMGAAGCSGLRSVLKSAPADLNSMMRPTLASTPACKPCTLGGLERTLMVCSPPLSVRTVKLNVSDIPVSHCVICVKGKDPRRSLPGGGPSRRRPARSRTTTTGRSPAGV